MKISTCHKRCRYPLFLLISVLFMTGTPALGADKKNADTPGTPGNLHVISDKLIAEQGKSMVEFIGNVKATRDDAVLLADSVKVFFKPSEKKENSGQKSPNKAKTEKGQGKVDKIIALGHVEYTAGDRKAYADKAVYTTIDEKLVLTGENPKLLTGKSWVAGRKITLFRLEERVMVESDGTKRVQAFFDSQDQNTGQKKGGTL